MPELDNSKPPLFVPSKRSYNDFVLAWRGHSRKRNYSRLLEWAENPDNAPEALTQRQTWNSRFFSDLVDSLYNGETDDAATAALAAMDAAADDGMQLWTALKREIDITLPSARSHAEDQLKTKTKQKHDETVAEFGLRFRGAVREFKNRGGEMTNYKYAELFAANVHERHRRIALELVTDLDPTTTTRSSYPTSSVAPTNARPYTIVSYAQIQKTADAALHYPCKGAAVAVTAAARVAEEAATPNVSTRSDTTDAAKMQTVQLHTLTTLRCVMRLAARVTTQHVGAATPTQAAEVAVDEADIKVAEADEEDDTRAVHSTAAALHATQHQNFQQLGVSSATTTVAIAAHANNIARYIVDNASPYTLTGSLNHLYDVQQLEKPKEIGGIKKDSTIKCTHVGKIDFTTHEGTLTVSNAYYGFYFGQIDVETAYLYALNEIWILVYVDDIIFASKNEQTKDIFAGHLRKKYRITEPAQLTWALGMKVSFAADGIILTQDLYVSKILERFGFTSAAKSATTPLAHGTTLTRADEEDAEARHLAQQFVGAILYAAVISRPDLSSTVRVMSHVMSKPPSNFEACKKHVLRSSDTRRKPGDNHENRRSTSGYIFFLNGGPISWASYLQTTVALSTVESEVMALTEAIKEAIYIRRLLESLGARKKAQLSFTRIQQELKRSSIIRRRTGERNTSRSDASSSSFTSDTKRSKSNE
ncbi:retrovirus-related Pol polyprotein [Pseudoscourfieldia marina]